jgi:glutathione S-transferase
LLELDSHPEHQLNNSSSMPRPTYTLYTPEASFRAFPILIAAEYNGVAVTVNTTDTEAIVKQSPMNTLPILSVESKDGSGESALIGSSAAATRLLASVRSDSGLLGRTALEAATIATWMDWCTSSVELPACIWFYPVAGYMPFNAAAYVDTTKIAMYLLCGLDSFYSLSSLFSIIPFMVVTKKPRLIWVTP